MALGAGADQNVESMQQGKGQWSRPSEKKIHAPLPEKERARK